MSVLTTNALDEDRFVHRARHKGVPITMLYVDSEDVSSRGLLFADPTTRRAHAFCFASSLQPIPTESPDKAALARVDQKLLNRVQRVSRVSALLLRRTR